MRRTDSARLWWTWVSEGATHGAWETEEVAHRNMERSRIRWDVDQRVPAAPYELRAYATRALARAAEWDDAVGERGRVR